MYQNIFWNVRKKTIKVYLNVYYFCYDVSKWRRISSKNVFSKDIVRDLKWHSFNIFMMKNWFLFITITVIIIFRCHYLSLKKVTQCWFSLFRIHRLVGQHCRLCCIHQTHSHKIRHCSKCWSFYEWEMGWTSSVSPLSVIYVGR